LNPWNPHPDPPASLSINQGDIFELGPNSVWIVVDDFHNTSERHPLVHCAPILSLSDAFLPLDVYLSMGVRGPEAQPRESLQQELSLPPTPSLRGSYAELGLIRRLKKTELHAPLATAHPEVMNRIRRNLVTWFSLFTMVDLTSSVRLSAPTGPPSLFPGTITRAEGRLVCVIDHWGCFNSYPLLYVAPLETDALDLCPLDVEITEEFQDLFSKRNFVRTDEFFLVDRNRIEASSSPPIRVLRYGLLRKISRALVLKFGQKSLLL